MIKHELTWPNFAQPDLTLLNLTKPA